MEGLQLAELIIGGVRADSLWKRQGTVVSHVELSKVYFILVVVEDLGVGLFGIIHSPEVCQIGSRLCDNISPFFLNLSLI